MTCKHKQNLRFKKIAERIDKKVRYDGFGKDEVNLIKAKKEYEQVDRELNRFWREAPRLANGQVDWDNLSEDKLNCFNHIYKKSEKLLKKINSFEDKGIDIDRTMYLFMQLNLNSVSY